MTEREREREREREEKTEEREMKGRKVENRNRNRSPILFQVTRKNAAYWLLFPLSYSLPFPLCCIFRLDFIWEKGDINMDWNKNYNQRFQFDVTIIVSIEFSPLGLIDKQ